MALTTPHTEYHGTASTYIWPDYGTLVTDRTGLSTATATASIAASLWANLPGLGSAHPIWTFMVAERTQMKIKGSFAEVTLDYVGFDNIASSETTGVFDLIVSLSEEPIETHPRFTSDIGGTPMNPLNGAVFRNISTGAFYSVRSGTRPDSNFGWVFDSFELATTSATSGTIPNTPITGTSPTQYKNAFAKIERYLEASQMTWRRSYNRRVQVPASEIAKSGTIQTPDGYPPTLPSGRNWLDMGISSTQRGSIYACTRDWKASGRRGWNTAIYGS